MRATGSNAHGVPDLTTQSRIAILSIAVFFIASAPAHADPLLLETGFVTGSIWLVLVVGLAIESAILMLFIRRPFFETLSVCLMANAITGFTGFVALLFLRIHGIPILPPGPAFIGAFLMEAAIITLMLAKPPVMRIFLGSAAANLFSAVIAMIVLVPLMLPSTQPEVTDDLELSRNLATVRKAIDTYKHEKGFFPRGLTGGSKSETNYANPDPLIDSGILESYPANPYAPYIRSRRLNPAFLLTGLGTPTRQVSLDEPSNEWEVRWFPILRNDPRFGDPDRVLLSANGLSDPGVRETLTPTFYHMNGADCVPGCFFYKSYDFNRDGLADDYILGAYGWPTAFGTVPFDLIDAATGDISLCLRKNGNVVSVCPDGIPEPVLMLHFAGSE